MFTIWQKSKRPFNILFSFNYKRGHQSLYTLHGHCICEIKRWHGYVTFEGSRYLRGRYCMR